MIEVRRLSFCAYKKPSQHIPFVGKNSIFLTTENVNVDTILQDLLGRKK